MAGESAAAVRLGQGMERFERGRYAEAIQHLKSVQSPMLADYTAYYLAASHDALKEYSKCLQALAPFRDLPLLSPLSGKALLLEAKARVEMNAAPDAVALLRDRYADLPQPLGDLALADAYLASHDLAQAAMFYQRVYYSHPGSDAAAKAGPALESLRQTMGESYPPPMAQQMLERGDRWLAAHEYKKGKQEFAALVGQLGGADGEVAAVRIGAADYLARRTEEAYQYLQSLKVTSPEADAERLYYEAECARRLDREAAMMAAVERLGKLYPQSPWRLRALVTAANRFMLQNQPDSYEPLYRACFETFSGAPEAAYCHWKVAWIAYLHRRDDAGDLLRQHVARFPAASSVSAALYYLGRLAENAKDYGAARACYTLVVDRYPGYYYGILARERMRQPGVLKAVPAAQTVNFLKGISFPERTVAPGAEPTAATTRRIERARLLESAGLHNLAELELRFGAKVDGQPHLLAIELARSAGAPYQSLHYMKSLVKDYLTLPADGAPPRFWEFLFPLPYRKDLTRTAGAQALDPNIVAGLIRQESEFNPKAVSPANARGLTQIVPGTARQLARRAGIRRFSTPMLFQPATNLKLGTTYLRSLLDQCGGKWEETLAAYNAGQTRVQEWLTWASFQEPSEFVETIPFTETREYVQSVLRNAAVYRRLYGSRMAAESEPEKPAPVKRASVKTRRRG